MNVLTAKAARQVRALRQYYEQRGRPEATGNLVAAIESAWGQIVTSPSLAIVAVVHDPADIPRRV